MHKNQKKRFILDTSACISLESIALFETVLTRCIIVTTKSVLTELNQFAKHNDALAKNAQSILAHQSQFHIKNVKITKRVPFLQETDNELYNLALVENFPLITDDHKLNHHTRREITVYFSTFFLVYCVLMDIITKKQALEKLEVLRDIRNWHHNLMYLRTKKGLEQLKE